MPFSLTQTVAPDAEPVSLDVAKAHLRVTWGGEDAYLRELLAGARDAAERESGRQFMPATYELTLDDFPRGCGEGGDDGTIRLPVGPVLAVEGVSYRDAAGATQALDPAGYDVGRRTGRVVAVAGWPATYAAGVDNVTVTYRAGYGSAALVPPAARAAVLLILADRYENRGDNVTNFLADRPIPAGALRLLRTLGDGHQW